MPRQVLGGLIQCATPIDRRRGPVDEDRDRRRSTKHLPLIEEAGKQGRADPRPAGDLQRPVLLPVARTRTGTTSPKRSRARRRALMAELREEVPDGDGRAGLRARAGRRLLQHRRGHRRRRHVPRQVPQEPHPAHLGVLGEVLLQAGQPRLPGVPDALREDRRLHLLRPPLPRGRAALGLNGAEIVFNPSATVAGLSQYLWKLEQPAHAVANGYFVALQQPRRHRGAVEHRQVLRLDATSSIRAASSSRTASEDKDELVVAELDLDMIEEVRRIWQFFRDRRPDTYGAMAEQLP